MSAVDEAREVANDALFDAIAVGSPESFERVEAAIDALIAAVRAETLDVQRLGAIYDSYTWPPLTNISRPRHLAEYVRAALERLP